MPHKDPEARRAYGATYRQRNKDRQREADARRYAEQAEAIKARVRAQYNANHEAILSRRRERYAARRTVVLAGNHRYHEVHAAEIRQQRRGYYERNREREIDRSMQWNRKYAERRRAILKRRAAQKRGAGEATLTAEQWIAIQDAFGHRCAYCGRSGAPLTQDHVIPLSRGGAHTIGNVVPACQPCNARKGTKQPHRPVQGVLL